MSATVSASARPVMLGLAGYGNQNEGFVNNSPQETPAVVYKIPPVVWPVVFLALGYFVIRVVMED